MATPITPAVTAALKGVLIDGARELIGNARAGAARAAGTGAFLAGPEPNNPIGGYQHRLGRKVCDRWARSNRDEILPGDDLVLRESCTPYLGAGAPGPPSSAPPFVGGQCAAPYILNRSAFVATVQNCPQPQFSVQQNFTAGVVASNLAGPITGIELVRDLNNACGPRRLSVRVTTATGPQTFLITQTGSPDDWLAVANPAFTLTRAGGLPDNCGNPPSSFNAGPRNTTPEPNPGPISGPPGYPFPNINVDVGPGGDITIDFGDGQPPEVIDPSNPEPDGGGGGVGPGDLAPGGGAPAAPVQTPPGGVADGQAPSGKELVGVLVQIVTSPFGANEYSNNPSQVFRGIGYVRMGYPGRLSLDLGGAAVISPQFFLAPVRGLTNWEVRANVGFVNQITPYYRDLPT